MLEIVVPASEGFNSQTNEFIQYREEKLSLEHSLLSIYQWESKHHKPFLSSEKTNAEIIDYIRCMTITKGVDPNVYKRLSEQNIEEINAYISDPMTATWFSDENNPEGKAPRKKETITAEIVYYWMIANQIPFECQKWHINKLLTLIRVCGEKNKPPKKLSKKELASRNRSLNALRRAQTNSKG